jgi:hypothetical protein
MKNDKTDTPRTDDLAKDILKLHTPDPQVIVEIAREQQDSLKKLVAEIGTVRLELIAAQESEAVWKTVADKADQRRIEAEARLAEAELLIQRGHDGWQKAEAEVERLKKLCEMAIESAEDALEERDLKRRIEDDIRTLKEDLNKTIK